MNQFHHSTINTGINRVYKKQLIIIIILNIFQLFIDLFDSQFINQILFELGLEIVDGTDNYYLEFLISITIIMIVLDMVQ